MLLGTFEHKSSACIIALFITEHNLLCGCVYFFFSLELLELITKLLKQLEKVKT